ncbi:MAG: ATP-binding protein [Candidatus Limnocylindrales bacterium]
MPEPYAFPSIGDFRDRREELAAIEDWFSDETEWRVLTLYGRRRVGKSWLFRAFAHGREADIFVASTRALHDQLAGFSEALERDGERPAIPDLEAFFRLLYRRARESRRLAIIDELPYLWTAERDLPSILLKVMEEEAASSHLKLLVAGSHVGLMERLLAGREPLHDRLRPLRVRALDFWHAKEILGPGLPEQLLTAYAVGGGLPRYLTELAGAPDPVARLTSLTLDPHGPLFDEPRSILAQELEVPHTYFSILAVLAHGPQAWGDISRGSRVEANRMGKYLKTLESLGIVGIKTPVTEAPGAGRNSLYELTDGFLRFWFRFVFPFQSDLEAGLAPSAVMESEIAPDLASHLSPAIEEVARDWVRRTGFGGATKVGSWWGPALDAFRASNERQTEEIDVVGTARGRVTLIGEVRWRSRPMDVGVLGEIDRFKLPALRRATKVVANPSIVLVSRLGFTDGLREVAARERHIRLVELEELVEG